MMPQVRWWFQHARCSVFKLGMEEESKWRDCKVPTESLAFTWEKTCKASRFKEYSRTRWICVGCCRPWNRNVSFRRFETSFEMLEVFLWITTHEYDRVAFKCWLDHIVKSKRAQSGKASLEGDPLATTPTILLQHCMLCSQSIMLTSPSTRCYDLADNLFFRALPSTPLRLEPTPIQAPIYHLECRGGPP